MKLDSKKFNPFSNEEIKFSKNVFYQQENTKEHFPSEREFHEFRKQRDLFYSILRNWEFKHLNPAFDFNLDLQKKVASLFQILNSPINMSHLAKLFVSQLIISCNFDDTTPEIQMALPNVDLNKLSKLQQRLVAPSHFSIEYLFPGNQAFFRDFIIASEISMNFIEQLKVVLIHELVEISNSSAESTNIVDVDLMLEETEYIIRPENMATLRVLAKFIGFIVSRPFKYGSVFNSVVYDTQISLRNTCLPPFDIKTILLKSIVERKILITIPWIVQYLSMLDHVTLQLDYYKALLNILYELYIIYDKNYYKMRPTVHFIIRTCLGWLFEHPATPVDYYSYRQNRNTLNILTELLNGYKISNDNNNKQINKLQKNKKLKESDLELLQKSLDPILESVLHVACPFLADFRVSIMPTKVLKTVSRTGRYRHITTKLTETNLVGIRDKNTDLQKNLLDQFLQSQSQSVRKTIDFVIERTTSAVIKDFQMEILIPTKRNVRYSTDKDNLKIYSIALTKLTLEWKEKTPAMIEKRVKEAFNSLLPNETMEELKKTYIRFAIHKCKEKSNEWRISYCSSIDIFMRTDIDRTLVTIPLDIDLNKKNPSYLLHQLQKIIHEASMYSSRLYYENIKEFLVNMRDCLDNQTIAISSYKMIAFMTLQMTLLLICQRPNFITDDFLKKLMNLWKCKKLEQFVTPPPESEDDFNSLRKERKINDIDIAKAQKNLEQYVFNDLINLRCLEMIRMKPQICFEMLGKLICCMIKNNLFTLSLLNGQCVTLFKQDLPEDILAKVSYLTDFISVNSTKGSEEDKKSVLFMEMLSDLARTLEDF